MESKFTTQSFLEAKQKQKRITMLTAYDYSMAKIIDECGIDAILVGDSLGMVVQGHDSTLQVTMDDMIYHCRCVANGVKRAFLVGDLPFLSYYSQEEAVKNAGRLIKEGRANAVKLEGGKQLSETIQAIVNSQIPVMGHIGLTPQSVNILGGFKVQGKEEKRARELIEDALAIEKAGAFAIVLEAVPAELAHIITAKVGIPTIGIGAGNDCDGQVLVTHDLLGMYSEFIPKFVKQYAHLNRTMSDAVTSYIQDVSEKRFPQKEHTFSMNDLILKKLQESCKKEITL